MTKSSTQWPSRRAALKVNEPLGDKRARPAADIAARPAKRSAPSPAVYALKAWTVKLASDGWHVAPTAYFEDKAKWRGPYQSLNDATTAIARQLEAEAAERHQRRMAFHREPE